MTACGSAVPVVAMIGGGFSGLVCALRLVDADPDLHVLLVEREFALGRGRPYSTTDPRHLLNVRVRDMSAFAERPDHFERWLRRDQGLVDPDGFVSRRSYGDYLADMLADYAADPRTGGRIHFRHDEALALRRDGAGYDLHFAAGAPVRVHAVVLATGLGAPAPPCPMPVGLGEAYVDDPWRTPLARLPQGRILLVGSGLTMIDVALSLDAPGRRLVALSRHGLSPRSHTPASDAPPLYPEPDAAMGRPREALRALRAHAARVGWRLAVDSMRERTQGVWQGWSLADRQAFLRRLQPWWNVHRHRIPTASAAYLSPLLESGALSVQAGCLESLVSTQGGVRARIRRRGELAAVEEDFAGAVNCTGPSGRLNGIAPLGDLVRQGLARPDGVGLGLDVDLDCRVLDAQGAPTPGLYAVGPLTRGVFGEATAVPEIRAQACVVADALVREFMGGGEVVRGACTAGIA